MSRTCTILLLMMAICMAVSLFTPVQGACAPAARLCFVRCFMKDVCRIQTGSPEHQMHLPQDFCVCYLLLQTL